MKPCNKVKNPCKFCLQQVNNKNGLQCQGACKKWAHFKCLNYTPGKISDIKAGIIKVTCPCPDCETTQPKEFLTNPPFTCSNNECPANKTPKCGSQECPSNKTQGRNSQPQPMSPPPSAVDYPDNMPECPNSSCSNEVVPCPAVAHPNGERHQQQQRRSHPRVSPPRPPTPPRTPRPKSPPRSPPCRSSPKPKNKCCSEKRQPPKPPKHPCTPDPCLPDPACPQAPPCPNDCTGQPKKKMKSPLEKSPSASLLSSDTSDTCFNKNTESSSSETNVRSPRHRASMVQALQEMCTTVGKLSVQLKDLMCKLLQNV